MFSRTARKAQEYLEGRDYSQLLRDPSSFHFGHLADLGLGSELTAFAFGTSDLLARLEGANPPAPQIQSRAYSQLGRSRGGCSSLVDRRCKLVGIWGGRSRSSTWRSRLARGSYAVSVRQPGRGGRAGELMPLRRCQGYAGSV